MLLIELFSDHVFNRKSLADYVEIRKSINQRGEFNDQLLIRAEENLQRLKKEDNKVYEMMYETLKEYQKLDRGCSVEYPINFITEILKLYKNHKTPQKVYEDYKNGLTHYLADA